MKEYQSLSHTRWDCKYHIVFIPKRRKKKVFGILRRHFVEIFHVVSRAQGNQSRHGVSRPWRLMGLWGAFEGAHHLKPPALPVVFD